MLAYIGYIIGALFLAFPLFIMYRYGIKMQRQYSMSFLRMMIRLCVFGVAVFYLVVWDNLLADIVFLLFMIAYSSVSVLVKSRLELRVYGVPVAVGIFASTVVVSCMLLLLCQSLGMSYGSRILLPMLGIVAGGLVDPVSKSLVVYYGGLLHHNQLYNYLLGNGADSDKALDYLLRRAMQKAVVVGMSRMSGIAVGITPLVMWIMVFCGTPLLDAVVLQVVLTIAVMSASLAASWVSLAVARHYSVDAYGRVRKPVVKKGGEDGVA